MKKECGDKFLEMEKKALNEMANETLIYDESQTGPQEEPCVKEYKLDLKKWRDYNKKHNTKK